MEMGPVCRVDFASDEMTYRGLSFTRREVEMMMETYKHADDYRNGNLPEVPEHCMMKPWNG